MNDMLNSQPIFKPAKSPRFRTGGRNRPYVHCGCHFLTINTPRMNMRRALWARIQVGLLRWRQALEDPNMPGDRREATERIVQFLETVRL